MAKQPKIVRAVHANRGVESRYRKSLLALIDRMIKSVDYWTRVAYNKNPPRLALDASPAKEMHQRIQEMADNWIKQFEDSAPDIADAYANSAFKATDIAFKNALVDAGWTVNFKMSRPVKDALDATIGENIGLIKSIPQKFFADLEGIVMRSYSNGRDLATMSREIRDLYPVTRKRAELISRDQSNKANAVVTKARRKELGITEAVWMHSHAGKVPRASHVAAHGKKFNVEEGCYIDGEYIQPGEKINCRCVSRSVLPFD